MASKKDREEQEESETERDEDERDEDEDEEETGDEDESDEDDSDEDDSDEEGDDDDSDEGDDDDSDEGEASDEGDSDEDDSDEDDDDDEDDDSDEEDEPPAKGAATKAKPAAGRSKPADDDEDEDDEEDDDEEEDAPEEEAPQGGSLGKSLFLFVVVVGGLAAGFWILGGSDGAGARRTPKWNEGQTVDVELTLVPSDSTDLACASATEIAGRKCEFESSKKRRDGTIEDAQLLKPYTTTDGIELTAAGLWSQPALEKSKLPKLNDRFSVKCKYKIEGKLKAPGIRWKRTNGFIENGTDWHAGVVSDCTMNP
jgi:hypothetical protein